MHRAPLPLLVLFCLLAATPALAGELQTAIGLSLPPYIIADENRGMEYDVAKEAMAKAGYTLSPKYVPFARVRKSLEDKSVAAALTVNKAMNIEGICLTQPSITYQNVAVTLKDAGIAIDSVEDLGEYTMIGFQGATDILGPAFKAQAEKSPDYNEVPDQEKQVQMLFLGRTQVFVGDINIFKYFRQALADAGKDVGAEVEIHEIFEPTPYAIGFVDEAACKDVDAALTQLRESGRHEEILNSYVQQ